MTINTVDRVVFRNAAEDTRRVHAWSSGNWKKKLIWFILSIDTRKNDFSNTPLREVTESSPNAFVGGGEIGYERRVRMNTF